MSYWGGGKPPKPPNQGIQSCRRSGISEKWEPSLRRIRSRPRKSCSPFSSSAFAFLWKVKALEWLSRGWGDGNLNQLDLERQQLKSYRWISDAWINISVIYSLLLDDIESSYLNREDPCSKRASPQTRDVCDETLCTFHIHCAWP